MTAILHLTVLSVIVRTSVLQVIFALSDDRAVSVAPITVFIFKNPFPYFEKKRKRENDTFNFYIRVIKLIPYSAKTELQ
jgi:hypothetical protein